MARLLARSSYLTFHVPSLDGQTFRTREEAEAWRSTATPAEVVEIVNFVELELPAALPADRECQVSGQHAEVVLSEHGSLHPERKMALLFLSRDGMVTLRDMLNDAIRAYHTPEDKG